MQTVTDHQQIIDIAESALERIGGRTMLTQGFSVNVFLDLYFATDDIDIRWAIADRLDDIRTAYSVEAADMRADLTAILEIVSTDVACNWPVAA